MSGYIGNIPVPQATQTRQTFTATASQTTFNTAGYSPGYIDVFLNGVKLAPADYTATNGSDVVLAVGAASGDILETVAYEIFQVLDQDFTGDFTVDGSTFVVDSTNNRVGVGTASPDIKFHVSGGNARIAGTEASGSFIDINASNTGSDGATLGVSYYGSGSYGPLKFSVGGSERARLDASGNLLVGTTSSFGSSGITLGSNVVYAAASSQNVANFQRYTTDGEIVRFGKDGTTVGSIGTGLSGGSEFGIKSNTGELQLATSYNSNTVTWDGSQLYPSSTNNLGASSARWQDLYLSGGVYLGGTGSANKLDDYEEGTWDPYWGGDGSDPSASYTNQNGWYVKVGNLVWCGGTIHTSSASGGSGNLLIRGLPFYSASDQANEVSTMCVGYANGFSTYYPTAGYLGRNRTFVNVTAVGISINTALMQVSYLTNSSYIDFNITYTTD